MSELIQNIINLELFNSQEASWQGPDSRTTLRQLLLQTDMKRERDSLKWFSERNCFLLVRLCSASLRNSEHCSHSVLTEWCQTCACMCVCACAGRYTHARTAGNSLCGCTLKLFSIELLISSRAKISTQKWSVWGQKWFAIKEFPLSTEIWRRRRRKKKKTAGDLEQPFVVK